MFHYTGPYITVKTKHGDKPTTKCCPICGNTELVLLQKFNEKICTNHEEFVIIPWYREEGEPELI